MIGKIISHYKILEKLGEGCMGVVYLAKDLDLERNVAIKFLPQNFTNDTEHIERFKREAKAAASLNNPNIVTIHEISECDGQIFIVMEYVDGSSLREKIEKGRLLPEEVVEIISQICEGLSDAHKTGTVHRDIKPENIIIDRKRRVKVLDFGLAMLKGVSKLTKEMSTLGTLHYMSPEQIRGMEVDKRTDVWSTGILMYEMLTGDVPFKGEYEQAVFYEIVNEDPQPFNTQSNNLSSKIDRIFHKALAKEPTDRYQDMELLLSDLRSTDSQSIDQIVDDANLSQPESKSIQSLAVLPLQDHSRDPEQEYFADGMTESLITALAKLGTCRVISRTSVMRYKETELSLPEIARKLDVDAVVEGSVLRAGQSIRITAQLIQAETDAHLWADSYERDLQDILFLQRDIAEAITKEIQIKLTPQQKKKLAVAGPVNPQSYEAYLKGRFHWYKLTPANFDIAHNYFQQALDIDPNYAAPYAGMAFIWLARSYWSIDPPGMSMPKSRDNVLKAIERDNSLELAHLTLANIKFYYDWDWGGAESSYQHSIELNPNYADSHLFYAAFLRSMNRPDEAFTEVNKGLELDPHNFFTQGLFVGHLLFLRRYDDAIERLNKILKEAPDFTIVHRYLWVAYQQKEMYEEALAEALKYFSTLDKSSIAEALSRGYKESGYTGAMNQAAKELVSQAKEKYVQPVSIARFYAYAGNNAQALEWLEKAFELRDLLLINLNNSCDWDNLRDEAGFQNLLSRMNFPS